MTSFDALYLARGWLSVALASGADKNKPVLHRTVCVEHHDTGVRLVATDSYMLLHAWVPDAGHADEPEPGWDEAPDAQHVAADVDQRGRNLMGYLHALADDDDHNGIEMALRADKATGDTQGMFDGMAATVVVVEFPGIERVTLPCVDAAYPDWRKTVASFTGKQTDVVALHPDRLTALAKLGKLHDGAPLLWRFGGREKPAAVEVGDSVPHVAGLVMPVRWDWDRAMPADDTPDNEDDE